MPALTLTPSITAAQDKTLWETPPALFDRLNQVFNFTLDACAQHHTAKVSLRYFVRTEDCQFCAGTPDPMCLWCDGLRQPWAPQRVWLNPPYGRAMSPWLAKAWEESQRGALVVALIPNDTSTRCYHDLVQGRAEIHPLDGRVKFVGAPGMPNFGNLLAIYWPTGFWKGC